MAAKKIFILGQGPVILMVASNMKACYECLIHRVPTSEKYSLVSYSQLTRIMKAKKSFFIQTEYLGMFHLSKNVLQSKYIHPVATVAR